MPTLPTQYMSLEVAKAPPKPKEGLPKEKQAARSPQVLGGLQYAMLRQVEAVGKLAQEKMVRWKGCATRARA